MKNFIDIQPVLFPKKEMYLMEHTRDGRSRRIGKNSENKRHKRSLDNMHLMEYLTFVNGVAQVAPYNGRTDFEPVAFTDRNRHDGKNQIVHFFHDDYKFLNRVWRNLDATTMTLSKFDCLFAPDFSMWRDLPSEQPNRNNVYRNRFVTAYWQHCGYNVIPVASWGGIDTLSYCFDGLPTHSVVAVSCTGNRKSTSDFGYWCYALQRMEEKLSPTQIIIYGAEMDVSGIHTPLKFIPDYITTHFRKNGKK